MKKATMGRAETLGACGFFRFTSIFIDFSYGANRKLIGLVYF